MAKLLKKGAEASIYLGEWFGEVAIFKIREAKSFRQAVLDARIRGLRTLHEASFLAEAKRLGVSTPLVYFVDRKQAEIVMQFIPGRRMKEVIDAGEEAVLKKWCREAGRCIARLHRGDVVHGDLTTSNFIITDDRLALIDFGLSFYSRRLEDRAVDLHLLNMVAQSAHSPYADRIMEAVLEGYREITSRGEVDDVLKRMKDVERRGRYKRVE
ncbi:MAG: KEOPS complex kinase/ATPase Bud32 [Nitrososphaerales archaeon]